MPITPSQSQQIQLGTYPTLDLIFPSQSLLRDFCLSSTLSLSELEYYFSSTTGVWHYSFDLLLDHSLQARLFTLNALLQYSDPNTFNKEIKEFKLSTHTHNELALLHNSLHNRRIPHPSQHQLPDINTLDHLVSQSPSGRSRIALLTATFNRLKQTLSTHGSTDLEQQFNDAIDATNISSRDRIKMLFSALQSSDSLTTAAGIDRLKQSVINNDLVARSSEVKTVLLNVTNKHFSVTPCDAVIQQIISHMAACQGPQEKEESSWAQALLAELKAIKSNYNLKVEARWAATACLLHYELDAHAKIQSRNESERVERLAKMQHILHQFLPKQYDLKKQRYTYMLHQLHPRPTSSSPFKPTANFQRDLIGERLSGVLTLNSVQLAKLHSYLEKFQQDWKILISINLSACKPRKIGACPLPSLFLAINRAINCHAIKIDKGSPTHSAQNLKISLRRYNLLLLIHPHLFATNKIHLLPCFKKLALTSKSIIWLNTFIDQIGVETAALLATELQQHRLSIENLIHFPHRCMTTLKPSSTPLLCIVEALSQDIHALQTQLSATQPKTTKSAKLFQTRVAPESNVQPQQTKQQLAAAKAVFSGLRCRLPGHFFDNLGAYRKTTTIVNICAL